MILFVLFLLSLISLLLYLNSYIDQFANIVRSNGIYVSVFVFACTILYSWYAKKNAYNKHVVDFFDVPTPHRQWRKGYKATPRNNKY
jgi:SNF family Na+-dependent transporter